MGYWVASRRRQAASRRRSVAATGGAQVAQPRPPPADARHVPTRPAARNPTLGSLQLRNSTRRLHPPLRAAWSVGAGASIPPRDAKQLLPPVGTGRGGWSRLVGSLRDLVTTRTLQQTSVPKPAPNPAHQGNKTSALCRATRTAAYPTLHMVFGWSSCDSESAALGGGI